jgi:DNA-binding CsgD family transcriptional regulator/tetratricopeptide (TPR) repeat protein
MMILERDRQLTQLHNLLQEAGRGHGRLVFLSAEAGGGKTTLVEHFAEEVRRNVPVNIFSCEGMVTPGPFGSISELATAFGPGVADAMKDSAPRDGIFRAIHSVLRNAPAANVIIGEDAHWTDEASLDLIRYLGRRIGSTRTLMVVTYRDDSIDTYHPLRRVLGDLVNEPAVCRMNLPTLSVEAVRELAAHTGLNPVELHERSGGNPFYVTEIVASGGSSIPGTVRDAVLARASRISVEGQAVLDVAAAIGLAVDAELLAAVIGAPIDDAVDECLAAGMFRVSGDGIAFRHALTRDVFLTALSPPRRRGLHRRILDVLERDPAFSADLAYLAHHAEEGRDREAVLRHAPAAAKLSARFGAHREAAAQFARALRFSQGMPDGELVELLEAKAYECYLTGQIESAIVDMTRAIELRAGMSQSLKVGDNQRLLSRFHWFAGNNGEAEIHAREALRILKALPSGPELAMAYSNLSQLRMLAHDSAEAIYWGERAIELAEEHGNRQVLAHALNNVGTATAVDDLPTGFRKIEEGLRIAREDGLHDDVSRAYANLSSMSLEHYELARAEKYIVEAIEFDADHDLIGMETYQRALLSRVLLSTGAWGLAEREAKAAAEHPGSNIPTLIVALTTLGQVQARRGDDASSVLDEALRLAECVGELQRTGPIRAARAEAAWLAGDPELAAAEAEREYANALRSRVKWLIGNLALWMHRGGRKIVDLPDCAQPFALEISGDGAGAAEIWRVLGFPLEEARALLRDGKEASVRDALAIFDRLGAKPDHARAVRALRSAGVRKIPRGPRPDTRANAALLTAREIDVLQRIVAGESNREIADALYLSPRTVGHHVSAILGKLDISSRSKARARAEELQLL